MSLMTGLVLFVAIAAVVAIAIIYLRQYKKVAPNEVLVISGGKKYSVKAPDGTEKLIGYRYRVGGGAFINPFTEKAEVLPLEVTTVSVKTPEVLTSEGVPILAEAIAQVRIDTADYALTQAIEQFLGKGRDAQVEAVEAVLEGKMRAVIGSMTVEEVYKNRLEFGEQVGQASEGNFAGMGLQMVSFALKDISDTQGYLDALGRPRIAAVKRDAAVAQAEADRDAAIQSSDARKEAELAKLRADAQVAKASWENEAKKADSQVEVNKRKAHADMSYELERNKIEQSLKKEEFAVKKIEKENQIGLEDLEIARKEKELEAGVLKPAEARKKQIQTEAEAESYRFATEAKGKAQARKAEAEAEAARVHLLGEAEAKAMAQKAKSYEHFNQAATWDMVMKVMPEVAKSVSEPLSRVEKIVMVGNDGTTGTSKITGQVSEILAQLPDVVESLTGVDVKDLLKKRLSEDDTNSGD